MRKKFLLFLIFFVHGMILLGLILFEAVSPTLASSTPSHVKVQTVILHPKKSTPSHFQPIPPPPKKIKAKQQRPASKQMVKKEGKDQKKIESLLETSLAHLERFSQKHENKASPGKEEPLPKETIAYSHLLKEFLQNSLQLPETGDIHLKISVKKDGSVQQVTILFAESDANRAYVESVLPTLTLPKPEIEEIYFLTLTDAFSD